MSRVFLTGGTGYMGALLARELLARGHQIRALARRGSESRLPSECTVLTADPLQPGSYADSVRGCDTFVHLIGVSHPSPLKASEFERIDFASAKIAVETARCAGIRHFVYVSVAHPAPMMKAYIAVRTRCESLIREAGLNATILRPWYVLGPGHRWPYLLLPFYKLAELIPFTREGSRRLGLVTRAQVIRALVHAVEHPATGEHILDVPTIRELSSHRP